MVEPLKRLEEGLFPFRGAVSTGVDRSRGTTAALVVWAVLSSFSSASAAPVLREADVEIVVTSSLACEVTMTLTVEGASEIDHRVETFSGGGADLVEMRGARPVGDVRSIGRTQSLVLRPDQATYSFRYRAQQPDDFADRCPILAAGRADRRTLPSAQHPHSASRGLDSGPLDAVIRVDRSAGLDQTRSPSSVRPRALHC